MVGFRLRSANCIVSIFAFVWWNSWEKSSKRWWADHQIVEDMKTVFLTLNNNSLCKSIFPLCIVHKKKQCNSPKLISGTMFYICIKCGFGWNIIEALLQIDMETSPNSRNLIDFPKHYNVHSKARLFLVVFYLPMEIHLFLFKSQTMMFKLHCESWIRMTIRNNTLNWLKFIKFSMFQTN